MNFLELAKQIKTDNNLIKSKEKTIHVPITDNVIINNICKEYENTSVSELARKYNTSRDFIYKVLKKNNIPKRDWQRFDSIPIDIDYFKEVDSCDKSYFLGFIAADGCIRKKKRNTLYLTIGLSKKDVKILEDFKKYTSSHHTLKYSEKIRDTGYISEIVTLSIYKEKFVKHIIEHGVGINKSKELSLPIGIPDELMPDYIRGLFDGDGCWNIGGDKRKQNIAFSIVSPVYSYLEELKFYFSKTLELSNGIKILSKKGCYDLRYCGNEQCKKIYDFLYKSKGPRLERKYIKATNHFNSLENLIGSHYGSKYKIEN